MAVTTSGAGLAYGSGDFYDFVLRNHYLPEVADGLNHDYVLLERFAALKDKSMVQGKFIQHPIHNGRNMSGVGALGYRGKLPTPGAQSYTEYQYPIRSNYGRILFTGLVQDASQTDIDSWLRAVDSELTGNRDDLARAENRMLHNDGSGILCEVGTGADSATQTVTDLNTNIVGEGSFDSNAMDLTHYLEVGMRIAGVDSAATPVILDDGVITSKTATQFTVDEATFDISGGTDPVRIVTLNEPASTFVVDSGYAREPQGLGGIISDIDMADTYYEPGLTAASFQNVAVLGNDFNQSVVLDNSGVRRPLTESLLQSLWSEVQKKLQGDITACITSFGVRDAFADTQLTYRRHVNRTELRAGFDTITYNNVPIIPDRDAYPNRLMALDESDIRQHCMGATDYRFIDDDGSIYHRLPDEHAFQASLFRRWTHGSFCRARHGLITDLDE